MSPTSSVGGSLFVLLESMCSKNKRRAASFRVEERSKSLSRSYSGDPPFILQGGPLLQSSIVAYRVLSWRTMNAAAASKGRLICSKLFDFLDPSCDGLIILIFWNEP